MGHSIELRRAFPLLKGLTDAELEAAPVTRIECAAGDRLFDQGDPGDAVYGVLTGRVRIVKQAAAGREFTLDVFGPGDLVAAVAVLRGVPMPASAIALEPTICLKIEGDWYKRVMGGHPELSTRTLDVMMGRLLEAGNARLRLATAPVEARLAASLLRMGDKFGVSRNGEIWIGRSFTRQNLADLAGTTVETTIRVMSRWTRDEWISSQGGRIQILKPAELQRIAET